MSVQPDRKPPRSEKEDRTLATYDQISPIWAKRNTTSDFWRDQFTKFTKLLPSGKIIDIGCGTGRDARLFLAANYDYLGIDASKGMVEQAKKEVPGAKFIQLDMYELSKLNEKFDGFWASASFLHIPKSNLQYILDSLKKITKSNAIGFISVKEGEGELVLNGSDGTERFFAFYSDVEFAQVLNNAGFEILERGRDLRDYSPPKNKSIWLTYLVQIKPTLSSQ